jgi:NTE family protein
MDETPLDKGTARHATRSLPFERVAVVLQGGGALGAYHGGVFAALEEAKIPLDWICGVSSGALSAALVVGNPPNSRIEKLREFWTSITQPSIWSPPLLADALGTGDRARSWANRISAFNSLLYGVPNFYTPRLILPFGAMEDQTDRVSYYDTSPLRATLEHLVDFDLINAKPLRLSVSVANLQTGEQLYFDNSERILTASHIMAACALPPWFPPIEIDGDYYVDGGVVSNSPMQFVADSRPRYSALVFQVDLWDPAGELPHDLTAANLRWFEIHSASRMNVSLDAFRKQQQARRALAQLLASVPPELRDSATFKVLAEDAYAQNVVLVRLKYKTKKYETQSKLFDFSRRSMEDHWQEGYEDARTALSEPGILELPTDETARIFDVHTGWVK